LRVSWTLSGGRLSLVWREQVKSLPPREERRGFGTTVLENMVGASLGAEVQRTLHDDGIEWAFSIPFASIDPDLSPDTRNDEAPREQPAAPVPEQPAA
jgi:two-component sensor histidine kinase